MQGARPSEAEPAPLVNSRRRRRQAAMSRRRTWIAVISVATAVLAAGASAAFLAGGARLPNVLGGGGEVHVSNPAPPANDARGANRAGGPRFTDVTAASGIDYTHWRL